MNQRERQLLGRVYACVTGTSGLRARNPADIKTIALYHSEMDRILRPLANGVSSLGYGDYELCDEYLSDAETELARAKARSEGESE